MILAWCSVDHYDEAFHCQVRPQVFVQTRKFSFSFPFIFFLGLHLGCMEVPKLGV